MHAGSWPVWYRGGNGAPSAKVEAPGSGLRWGAAFSVSEAYEVTPPRMACFRMDYARKTAGAMCSSVGALHARGIFVPCTLRKGVCGGV